MRVIVSFVARRRIDENQPEGISPGTSAPDPAPNTEYGAVTTIRGEAGCSEASVIPDTRGPCLCLPMWRSTTHHS
jgi:hypothetical protein